MIENVLGETMAGERKRYGIRWEYMVFPLLIQQCCIIMRTPCNCCRVMIAIYKQWNVIQLRVGFFCLNLRFKCLQRCRNAYNIEFKLHHALHHVIPYDSYCVWIWEVAHKRIDLMQRHVMLDIQMVNWTMCEHVNNSGLNWQCTIP